MRAFNCVWVHSGHDRKKQHFNENLLTVKLKLLVLSLEITGTLDYHHLQICEASVFKNMRGNISLEKHMPSDISLGKKKAKQKTKKKRLHLVFCRVLNFLLYRHQKILFGMPFE